MTEKFPINTTQSTLACGRKIAETLASAQPENKTLRQLADQYLELEKNNIEIQSLLHDFNLGVQGSFPAGGVQGMTSVCSAKGHALMQKKYTGWRQKGVKALNLVECNFLAYNLQADNASRARAFTFEKWVFVYENGEEVFTQGSIDRYDLVRQDDGWKMENVDFFPRES